jgi:beta-1,4-mannosyl-glycoprotein beta-1,4-N-acetylglucosaminyltransferase
LERTKNIKNLNISYQWINDLDITLNENVDLTFIDTWHVGGHLKKELKKFSKLTNKYIIMHDTTIDEFTSEAIRANLSEEQIINLSHSSRLSVNDIKMGLWPAIEDFLKNNPEWALHERYTNNNGLTILKKKPSKKIVDCFIFYNELDLLKYRLSILNDYVDYFVIVEATHTFVGKEKPLFYQENKELFKEFNHKIIHIVVDDFSHKYPNINIKNGEQWNNEIFQRNCIKRGLDKLQLNDEDIFTVTDLDEIPDPKILTKIKKNEINIHVVTIELDFYYYNLNCKINGPPWNLSKMISYKKYKELSFSCQQIRQNMSFEIIPNAGWHLSYFGDEKFIKNKIENFGHQELNIADFTDENNILNRIKNQKDLYNRYNPIVNVEIEDNNNLPPKYEIYLTKYYTNNIQNIKSNLIKYSNLRNNICHFKNYDDYINWQIKVGLSFEKDNTEWMNGQRKCVETNFNTMDRNIKILDICCGDGQGLKKFKEMGFKNVCGVEVCKEKINFAKQYGYAVYECDICCGPFEIGDKYDCIYSSHTIEHVLNPEYTIRNIMSKLKDNGIFILILPYPDYGAANPLDEHRFKVHCGVIPLGLHINDKGYTICNTIQKMGYKITDYKFESYREPEIQLIITK